MPKPLAPRDLVFDMDYCSSPVWTPMDPRSGLGDLSNLSVGGLPISAQLKDELTAYSEEWTRLGMAELTSSVPTPASVDADLELRATDLCRRLREELGSGWRVGWPTHRDGQRYIQWADDQPPEHWPCSVVEK